jgi:hypothetical protein
MTAQIVVSELMTISDVTATLIMKPVSSTDAVYGIASLLSEHVSERR